MKFKPAHFSLRFTRKTLWGLGLALGVCAAAGLFWVFWDLPDLHSLPQRLNTPSLRLLDRNGRLIYEVLPQEGGRHAVVALDSLPACMLRATIAVEDENFYQNPGVDPVGILRAFWINLRGGETLAGGSTITQQVARNLLLGDERYERSLRRKLREAWLAWSMAREVSKDEILALYLNQTYYGGFAYGIEAAAQTYFDKPASALLLPECALLAGLPQAPSLYNPFSNPQKAKERQEIVLKLMEKNGWIDADERRIAAETPLQYNARPFPIEAPHFAWMVKDQVDDWAQQGLVDARASLVVHTTLDLNAQRSAGEAINRQIASFRTGGLEHYVRNAALVALDPHSGQIRALVGSADYFNAEISGALNMATAVRQPGSAFKPFIYAAALNPSSALPWTAATPLLDVSTTFQTGQEEMYVPKNYDELEHGIVTLREALASSLNIPAVLTLDHVGVPAMTNLAQRLGVHSLQNPAEYDLSLALGGGQMSLLELTAAYATFANGGAYPGLALITSVNDADGRLIYQPPAPLAAQVFDPRVAWLISDMLSDDFARQMGFGRNSTLKLDRPAAVKTGTTTNFHDNWTVGYTPSLVVGVWVGNSDYQEMRDVNGLTGAAPIWHQTMRTLLQGQPAETFTRPEGLRSLEVCTFSGLLPTPACERRHTEWFIEGTQPTTPDTLYQQVEVDASTGRLATASTPAARRQMVVALDLPVRARPWAAAQGLLLLSDLTAAPAQTQNAELALLSPEAGAIYRLTDKTAAETQQLPVQVLAGDGLGQVTVWVDGVLVRRFEAAPDVFWWPLAAGTHVFEVQAIDLAGRPVRSAPVSIQVER